MGWMKQRWPPSLLVKNWCKQNWRSETCSLSISLQCVCSPVLNGLVPLYRTMIYCLSIRQTLLEEDLCICLHVQKVVVCFQWILGCSVTGEWAICSTAELECCLEKHLYKKLPWFLGGFSACKCNNGKNRKMYKELTVIMLLPYYQMFSQQRMVFTSKDVCLKSQRCFSMQGEKKLTKH